MAVHMLYILYRVVLCVCVGVVSARQRAQYVGVSEEDEPVQVTDEPIQVTGCMQ